MQRTIMIWGAGRIGRGFVADIFNSPDFHTVFVDIDADLVAKLNAKKRYTVCKATRDGIHKNIIENGFEAVHTGDEEKLRQLFREENLLLDIAVHEPKLPEVADMVAPLITWRAEQQPQLPMDIMMNVNMAHPDKRFISLMKERLTGKALEYFENSIGVTGIFAMCISPLAPDWLKAEDELALWNNGYHEQAISRSVLKCPPPVLPRLRLTDDIEREELRKLYTLNMAHAFLCYMGIPMGLKTSLEAVKNEILRPQLEGALLESSTGLIHSYGFGEQEMEQWRATIIALLENPYIEDGLQRLGADTRRKLSAHDRLVGPATLCKEAGMEPVNLMKAVRAGFDYVNPDEGTTEVHTYYLEHGLEAAMEKYCGIPRT